jgi:hypothetical protein
MMLRIADGIGADLPALLKSNHSDGKTANERE